MTTIRVQGSYTLYSSCFTPLPCPAAGLAIARFALAIAPHAHTVWLPCDPYSVAIHLRQWGKSVITTVATTAMPDFYDLCIDCGNLTNPDTIDAINTRPAPVLAVNAPSGLCADTGMAEKFCVHADWTLALGTLSVGLFTADGRTMSGQIWFNDLDLGLHLRPENRIAQLNAPQPLPPRPHNTHKGSFGDVAIIGGATGMAGAALLAGMAALHGGAGRVFVGLLDAATAANPASAALLLAAQPELMLRHPQDAIAHHATTIVAGCGGGASISALLPSILASAQKLVLDADALNAIAHDAVLQQQLRARPPHSTVLTPHPLEAARLLGMRVTEVQANRLQAAQTLANHLMCVVVLKGSGSIIAMPSSLSDSLPRINPTGNARLAAAGTGDVLAGLLGAYLAAGLDVQSAAYLAVFRHGEVADNWNEPHTLTARELARRLGG